MNKDIEELFELAHEAIGYVSPYFREKWDMDNRLETLRTSISGQPHWIPCDEKNPPPADTPMLVWKIKSFYTSRQASWVPRLFPCHENYNEAGQPGEDFTFYMLTGEPG